VARIQRVCVLAGCLLVAAACTSGEPPPTAPTREETFAEIRLLIPRIHFPPAASRPPTSTQRAKQVRHLAGLHFVDVTQLSHDEEATLLDAGLGCEGDPATTRSKLNRLIAGNPWHWPEWADPAAGRNDD